jgi:zinc D-Ala-D-Ala carboxypeptidase
MNYKKPISKHVSYSEATKSLTAIRDGIDNTPGKNELANMKHIALNIFEKVRGHFCCPIHVSSFYRSPELNRAVKGSKTSQHVKGEAMDLDADTFGITTNKRIFDYIRKNLEFDQLIWEHGTDKNPAWVHVSLKKHGVNKKQVLVAYKEKDWRGKLVTKYKPYED